MKFLQPFLITGCGRSGTQYITRVLRCHGLHVAHEGVFVPGMARHDDLAAVFAREWLHGEVSWFAAPYLDQVPDDWLVVHLVRNPIRVIRSWVALRLWEGQFTASIFVRRQLGWTSWFQASRSPIAASMEYWVAWNQLVREKRPTAWRLRIEDFSTDARHMVALLHRIGLTETLIEHVEPNLRAVRKDVGSAVLAGKSLPLDIKLSTLPAGRTKELLVERALEFGYTLNDLEDA